MRRITICIDVELNDIAASRLELEMKEMFNLLIEQKFPILRDSIKNYDSCIDEVKED